MTGKDIIDICNLLKVSTEDMAAFLDCSPCTLDRWIKGTLRPNKSSTVLLLRSICSMFLPAPRGRGLDKGYFIKLIQNSGGFSSVFEILYEQAVSQERWSKNND